MPKALTARTQFIERMKREDQITPPPGKENGAGWIEFLKVD
jgi:hypothetical protein